MTNMLAAGRTQALVLYFLELLNFEEEQQWGLVQWLTSGANLDWFLPWAYFLSLEAFTKAARVGCQRRASLGSATGGL